MDPRIAIYKLMFMHIANIAHCLQASLRKVDFLSLAEIAECYQVLTQNSDAAILALYPLLRKL